MNIKVRMLQQQFVKRICVKLHLRHCVFIIERLDCEGLLYSKKHEFSRLYI